MRRLAAFLILFVFWLILSGHMDPLHLGLGFICALLVTLWSSDFLFRNKTSINPLLMVSRVIAFIPWLVYQIVLANLHVAYLVLFPKNIQPKMIHFKTYLTDDLALVTLANSITLTPGTITVDIEDGEFCVHVLSDRFAQDLLSGKMERRVAHIFSETTHLPSTVKHGDDGNHY